MSGRWNPSRITFSFICYFQTGVELKVEAILGHRRSSISKTQYLIKWKDEAGTKSWETYQKARSACPTIFHDYIARIGDEVGL